MSRTSKSGKNGHRARRPEVDRPGLVSSEGIHMEGCSPLLVIGAIEPGKTSSLGLPWPGIAIRDASSWLRRLKGTGEDQQGTLGTNYCEKNHRRLP